MPFSEGVINKTTYLSTKKSIFLRHLLRGMDITIYLL